MNYRITFSARFYYRLNTSLLRHYHTDYQIQLVYSGSAEAHLNDTAFTITAGMIVFIKKGSYHDFHVTAKEGMKTLELKFVTDDTAMDSLLADIPPVLHDTDQLLFNILARIVLEGQRKTVLYREMSEALLMESLITMFRISGSRNANIFESDTAKIKFPQEKTPHIIELVDDYIAQNINRNFSLAEMAKTIGYNQDYLYRTIKKETGISAVQYISRIKFEKAKQLIQHTELSLTEISWNLGFDDLQYFSRFFKKYAKISPSEYSANVRSAIRTDY